jgi:hypothetical protein
LARTIIPTKPCSPRNKSKAISFVKNGFIAVVTATQADPRMKIMRLPKISVIRPQSSKRQPNAREYADTTHWTRASGIFRSLPMVGRIITTAWADIVCPNLSADP